MPDSADVPTRVRKLARKLAEPIAMRRGSVSLRYVKCNKAGCACAERPEARHGPYCSVVRVVRGQTRSRWVPMDRVEQLRQQVEAGRQFRKRVEAYWEACEEWADAELEVREAVPQGEAKKGGSRRRSRRRSPRRSKGS